MKNFNIRIVLIVLFLTLDYANCYAQKLDREIIENPQIILKAKAKGNKILLRWAVNDKLVWKHGLENGYVIERITIARDNKPLEVPEKLILNEGPIKPRPLANWEGIIKSNDMAAVAAQAIYGDEFLTNREDENFVLKVINESSEQQQRFGFSMFAIDQNFEAALYAGLGFIDDKIRPNERFLYNIKLANSDEKFNIKETGVLISASDNETLPKPYDFSTYYYNDAFVLIWEYDGLQSFYNSYDIEKSTDSINFSVVNKAPITKLNNTESSGISYTDSITQYEKKYWYRIRGKTAFDEIGPSSDVATIIAYKKLLVTPEFRENKLFSEKEVLIKWSFESSEAWKVTHFDVLRGGKAIGPYLPVEKKIDSKVREYRYDALKDINYFKVRAYGIAGDYQDSSPNMIQPIDSIPPNKPKNLVGTIDTLGIVRLKWAKSLELDLKGYEVSRTNRSNQEFTRLHKEELITNSFTDTINLKSFNSKVYYRLKALDNRYNTSIASDTLVLERPDMIPPSAPLFTEYNVMIDGVEVEWKNSSSNDVVQHIIYRKHILDDAETEWLKIYEVQDITISSYVDNKIDANSKYVYTIIAKDVNNLESEASPPLYIYSAADLIRPKIKGFYANVNRELKFIQLSWRFKESQAIEIQLFRKNSESDYTLYQTLSPTKNKFADTNLKPNTTYVYGLKAIFNDGSISELSELEVRY